MATRPFIKATTEMLAEIMTSFVAAVEWLKRTNWNKHKPKAVLISIPS